MKLATDIDIGESLKRIERYESLAADNLTERLRLEKPLLDITDGTREQIEDILSSESIEASIKLFKKLMEELEGYIIAGAEANVARQFFPTNDPEIRKKLSKASTNAINADNPMDETVGLEPFHLLVFKILLTEFKKDPSLLKDRKSWLIREMEILVQAAEWMGSTPDDLDRRQQEHAIINKAVGDTLLQNKRKTGRTPDKLRNMLKAIEDEEERKRAFFTILESDELVEAWRQYKISAENDDIYTKQYNGKKTLYELFLERFGHGSPEQFEEKIKLYLKNNERFQRILDWITLNHPDIELNGYNMPYLLGLYAKEHENPSYPEIKNLEEALKIYDSAFKEKLGWSPIDAINEGKLQILIAGVPPAMTYKVHKEKVYIKIPKNVIKDINSSLSFEAFKTLGHELMHAYHLSELSNEANMVGGFFIQNNGRENIAETFPPFMESYIRSSEFLEKHLKSVIGESRCSDINFPENQDTINSEITYVQGRFFLGVAIFEYIIREKKPELLINLFGDEAVEEFLSEGKTIGDLNENEIWCVLERQVMKLKDSTPEDAISWRDINIVTTNIGCPMLYADVIQNFERILNSGQNPWKVLSEIARSASRFPTQETLERVLNPQEGRTIDDPPIYS